MKKYIALIVITVILSTLFVCGCNEQKKEDGGEKTFVGRWKLDMEGFNETWNFKEDGTASKFVKYEDGTSRTEFFTWEDNGFELCLIPNVSPEGRRCGTYEFSNNYNSYTWKPDEQVNPHTAVLGW